MKALIVILLLLSPLAIPAFSQPDTLWTKTFGGISTDVGRSVQQTSDGGFIIAGYTYSYGAGGSDVYLIKTDAVGDTTWTKTFGGNNSDNGYSVQQTADGGYIIAGYTYSYGVGNDDVYLIKTDAFGDTAWTKTFGGSYCDYGESVQQTVDGGYIIAGYTYSYGAGNYDVYLIKTDAVGDTAWTKTFGGSDWERGYSVQQTSDEGYIIVGKTCSYGAGSWDVYLIKTDASGDTAWTKTFGGSWDDYGYSVQQTADGGYIIAGGTESYSIGNDNVYLIKTDASGNLQWYRTFGGSGYDVSYSVQQTADGGYIIAGYTWSYGAGGYDIYLIKTDAVGDTTWTKTFGGSEYDYGYSVQQTFEGGYIITGFTTSYGAGLGDVYLIRTAREPLPPITINLTPLNPPIQIPAIGGIFSFNLAAENTTGLPLTMDIWTKISLPSVGSVGPLILVEDFTLQPNYSVNRDRTQEVPANAPAGEYLYYGYGGEYPWTIEVYDSFAFIKEGTDNIDLGSVDDWNCWGEGFEGEAIESYIPSETALHSPYPNPFNPSTVISFELKDAGEVSLIVFDVQGREVQSLVNGHRSMGYHEAVFDGSELASGIYFARLDAGGFAQTQKLLLIK
ncbi:MAG: T9SS type A sorting domain-containing protein [FCB group bacterium]|nr:T9SS type A sorting domain-containing protein [FCB group bacterium]